MSLIDKIERFIESLFGKVERLGDAVESKMDKITDSFDSKLDGLGSRFDSQEEKLSRRYDDLEKKVESKLSSLFGDSFQLHEDSEDKDNSNQKEGNTAAKGNDDASKIDVRPQDSSQTDAKPQGNPNTNNEANTPSPANIQNGTKSGTGLTFKGNNWRMSYSMNAYNCFYQSYTVSGDPELAGTYIKLDRGASKIIKEIADSLGIKYSASANAAKIAELILTEDLGAKYLTPVRGESATICNHTIINGYLIEHVYENNGCGWADSIKKNAHVYVKIKK
ncbi:MAG: hypothetical protein K2M55_03845 [Muribaculaceae bacterium]|nr:hypothetical protein [Muribaculaceae bacterium]